MFIAWEDVPMSQSLSQLLRQHRLTSLLGEVRLVRDWAGSEKERLEWARRVVRAAMYEHSLDWITLSELHEVYRQLFFAIELHTGRLRPREFMKSVLFRFTKG